MYYRRKVILALLQKLKGNVSATDFQKYLFLFTKLQSEPSFEFVPYRFGCFSFQSYADRRWLETAGLVESGKGTENPWVLLSDKDFIEELTAEDQTNIKLFSSQYASLKGSALIKYVYKHHPFFAINSVIADKHLTALELKAVVGSRPANNLPEIFSIGYEGKSVDRYLCQLIEQGIQLLCDVRKNPLSRKYGFSKKQLKRCVESLGIEYRHLPQLGIESQDRKSLSTFEDYQQLFTHYEKTTLKREKSAIDEIITLFEKYTRIAITCFEADHHWCHRSCVADTLECHAGYHQAVTHL